MIILEFNPCWLLFFKLFISSMNEFSCWILIHDSWKFRSSIINNSARSDIILLQLDSFYVKINVLIINSITHNNSYVWCLFGKQFYNPASLIIAICCYREYSFPLYLELYSHAFSTELQIMYIFLQSWFFSCWFRVCFQFFNWMY